MSENDPYSSPATAVEEEELVYDPLLKRMRVWLVRYFLLGNVAFIVCYGLAWRFVVGEKWQSLLIAISALFNICFIGAIIVVAAVGYVRKDRY